jgi:hypothetical protein
MMRTRELIVVTLASACTLALACGHNDSAGPGTGGEFGAGGHNGGTGAAADGRTGNSGAAARLGGGGAMSAADPGACDCGVGAVCVENLPTGQMGGNPECMPSAPRPGNQCDGLQVYDATCGGCVPSPCAGKCFPSSDAGSPSPQAACITPPDKCDPLSCDCFNPCVSLKCTLVGMPIHVRCALN